MKGEDEMQLKLSTDYAMRIILYLYIHKKASSLELSKQLGISRNYIKKLVTRTRLQEFVSSSSGIYGGFVLRQDARDITMYDVLKVMEPSMFVNSCLEDEQRCINCTTFLSECPLKNHYQKIQDMVDHALKTMTIHDLSLNHKVFCRKLGTDTCR